MHVRETKQKQQEQHVPWAACAEASARPGLLSSNGLLKPRGQLALFLGPSPHLGRHGVTPA